jgi:hypothetical protein
MLLTLCEKYSMSPIEFDELPDMIKLMMIAKYKGDQEIEKKAHEKAEKERKN